MIVRKREHFTLPSVLETGVLLYLQGAVIMNPNCVRKPEQIKLIMECRQSGLSDYQWCREQGIHPGTFYNWVSKLRKAGYTLLITVITTVRKHAASFYIYMLQDWDGKIDVITLSFAEH